ncbi:MAG: FecR domain-containing protein [Gemmataceae bacterium]
MLANDPTAADALVRLAEFDAALANRSLRPSREAGLSTRVSIARKRRWLWVAAATILLAVAASATWFARFRPELSLPGEPSIVAEQDSGRRVIDPKGDAQVPLRQRVEAPQDRSALLTLPGGARTELSPASVAIFHGKVGDILEVVELIEGEGAFRVQKGKGAFRVQTVAGNVTALGTEFKVGLLLPERAKDDRKKTMPVWLLEVDVTEGTVEVESWKEKTTLTAPARQVFKTERPPDLRGTILSQHRLKRGAPIEIEIEVVSAHGPPQVRTLRTSRNTRTNRDFRDLVARPASVWLEAGSFDTVAWIVGD